MFLFFKQKTAYEMRISDWSSDVCSSDLEAVARLGQIDVLVSNAAATSSIFGSAPDFSVEEYMQLMQANVVNNVALMNHAAAAMKRSEERRVGTECVSTCSSRWWQLH